MMRTFKYGLVLLALLFAVAFGFAQKPGDLTTANDHLILLLDLHDNNATLQTVLKNAGINNVDPADLKNKDYSGLQKLGWSAQLSPDGMLHLQRAISNNATGLNVTVLPQNPAGGGYPGEVAFGVNNFSRVSVHELENGVTRFFIPGNQRARRIMLSGNFNSWSTLSGPMTKTDTGWIRDVRLEPGIYEYKFIIDGRWTNDINNNLRHPEAENNSIYYRYNFTFKLPGYADAHRVAVAGSFNNWNGNQLVLRPVADGWAIRMFLHEGVHAYHFLVDGKIVNDPANSLTGKGDDGKPASIVNLGQVINFRLGGYENAQHVYVSGTFNNWVRDELEMKRVNGVWTLPLTLAAGNYQYKFVVDGNWILDPTNQHKARFNDNLNSFISVRPNHTFHLKGYGNAHKVILSGTFNDWAEDYYTLEHNADEWTISLRLKPGKYLYKFIADGNWLLDPGNKLMEPNRYGTGNSVLWVE
jgi:hypothetical protein